MDLTKEQFAYLREHYLTEDRLEELLKLIFPEVTDWLHDKKFLDTKYRPDFRSDSLKLIIEFDGYQHYSKATAVFNDLYKNAVYEVAGYKVVRIPHFVQLETNSIKYYFDRDVDLPMVFKHGFRIPVDAGYPPASMCERGVWRFLKELKEMENSKEGRFIRRHIISSLIDRIQEQQDTFDKKDIDINFAEDLVLAGDCISLIEAPYAEEERKLLLDILEYEKNKDFIPFEPDGTGLLKMHFDGISCTQMQALFDNGFIEENNHQWHSPTNKECFEFQKRYKDNVDLWLEVICEEDMHNLIVCEGLAMSFDNDEMKQDFIKTWSNAGKNGIYFHEDGKSASIVWR